MPLPSEFDEKFFPIARDFINKCRSEFLKSFVEKNQIICDVGSQGKLIPDLHDFTFLTLDVSSDCCPDIVADITRHNEGIADNFFDVILCTDVLEHVVDPFAAIKEMRRILKNDGLIFVSTPLNSRIHGPVPDCWRFTEFGLRVMFRDFEIVSFKKLDTPDRNLFPLQYCLAVRKVGDFESDPRSLRFAKIE